MKQIIRIIIGLLVLMSLMQSAPAVASPGYLWEQLPGGDSRVSSFEGNWIFADDFELQSKISINQIEFWSNIPGPVEVNIKFYVNTQDGSGFYIPTGDPIYTASISSTGITEDSSICAYTYCTYRHTLTLSTPVLLNAGRYWVSIYGSTEFYLSYEDSSKVGLNLAAHWFNGTWYNNSQLNLALRIIGAPYVDQTPPVVNVPADVTVPATSSSGAVVTFSVTANDSDDGPLTPTCDPISGETFPIGQTTVTCSVTDTAGNPSSAQFTVTVVGISIGPDLPATEYTKNYSQQLTAEGGTAPYTFSLQSGPLPSGLTLSSTGLLSGFPNGVNAKPGTYPITIRVEDSAMQTASRAYDLVVNKGTPTMDVRTSIPVYWHRPFNLAAEVRMVTGPGSGIFLSGTVAFSVDGDPVAECQNVPFVMGYYFCEGVTSVPLEVGSHTVSGTYTPSTDLLDYYYPASDSLTFSVDPIYFNIIGMLFGDQDADGVMDSNEYSLGTGWRVDLDQDCDGTNIVSTYTAGYPADYRFYNVTAGQRYCITTEERPGYQRKTAWPDFTLTDNVFTLNIGYYYPNITLSPTLLASVNLGESIEQQFTATGGKRPYTYRISWGTLPDGLSFSEAGLLSGTPTAAGSTTVEIEAEDVNKAVGKYYYLILVKTNGVFSFTSSSNPSVLGDPVTFTVSASGSVNDPGYGGQIPPIGELTFFADGETIEDCAYLYLNYSEGEYGDFPATCTTSTLTEGSHQITVGYSPWSQVYNTPTFELTQVVQTCSSSIEVANLNDSGVGSLRQAILDVCPGGTITFGLSYPAVITLGGQIRIEKSLTILGPGADKLTISGGEITHYGANNSGGVFYLHGPFGESGVEPITVSMSGMTIKDGRAHFGGGIANESGSSLTLTDCVIGPNNIVLYAGGGIANMYGSITLNRCTVVGNHGTGATGGAGIFAQNGGSVTLINSTVTENVTNNLGGGILSWYGATVNLIHSTVSGNTANEDWQSDANGGGGGVFIREATVTIQNSIIAGNIDKTAQTDPLHHTPYPDVFGAFTSLTGNLIGDGTGATGLLSGLGDMVGSASEPLNPNLGNFAVTSPGVTPLFPLLPGSIAIDAVVCPSTVTTDQRGVSRPQGDACDIGAFELEQELPTVYELFLPLIQR